MSTDQRPYQGYPYTNPTVFDIPTISANDAARWQHLPRRQIEVNVARERPTTPPQPEAVLPAKRDSVEAPVVYIDMPQTSGSIVADRRPDDDFEMLPPERPEVKEDPDRPVVYIDMPEADGVASPDQTPDTGFIQIPPETPGDVKQDPDRPVVYIDMPEAGGVASPDQSPDTSFVQETIYYDPFDNRRIDRGKDDNGSDDDDDDDIPQVPPRRPNFLDLNGAGPSGQTPIPSIMSKETSIYTTRESGLPASIPASQFPQPPPSYTEIDQLPVVTQPRPQRPPRPPRTQVILPQVHPSTPLSTPITVTPGYYNDRKVFDCHHCGMRVNALIVKKTGCPTHLTAVMCLLIGCFPCIICIYCIGALKERNHYCPNCNKIIAYQGPFTDKINFVN